MSRTPRIALLIVTMLAALLPAGLGGSAYAADCGTLHAADVAYGAPRLTGELTEATPSACWNLDVPAGTPIILGEHTSQTTFTVTSGTASLHCGSGFPCRMVGDGPYVVTANRTYDSSPFDLQVLSLAAGSGCPQVTEAALGANDHPFSVDLTGREASCRTVSLPAGQHLVHLDQGNVRNTLVPSVGEHDCWTSHTEICAAEHDGTYVVASYEPEALLGTETVTGQIVDLDRVASCPAIDGSWSSPPVHVTGDRASVDCHAISGAATGDRYAVSTGPRDGSGDYLVTGGCGEPLGLGCALLGSGPFRVLSWGGSHDLVARRVGPGTDCPAAPVLAFGTTPTDRHIGAGCRRIEVPTGHPVRIAPYERVTGSLIDNGTVYDPSYRAFCFTFDVCQSDETGELTVVTNLLGDDTKTFVYDYASTAGCTAPPASLRTHRTDLTPNEVACETLDDPEGSVVTTFGRSGVDLGVSGEVVDASGADACAVSGNGGSCRLTGTAPFRVLLRSSAPHLSSTTLTSHDLAGCPTLAAGPTARADLTFASTTSFSCRHVAGSTSGTKELLHLFRTAGAGPMSVALVTDDGIVCGTSKTVTATLDASCAAPGTGYTIAVQAAPGTVRLAHVAVSDPDAIVRWRRPDVVGSARAGTTVRTDAGQWSGYYGAIRPTDVTWLLNGSPVHQGKSYAIPRTAGGKTLVVRVTARSSSTSSTIDSAARQVARP